MKILMIDTYDRATFEDLSLFTDESLNDRDQFITFPADQADALINFVNSGAIPTTRQPDDGITVTDQHVILTLTWLNLEAAQLWVSSKLSRAVPGLISSEVVQRD